jgi:transposase-like protein
MTHEIRRAGRPTNTIERLHEEFRRRVKTQGSLPSEAAALVLLFSLVASGRSSCKGSTGWDRHRAQPAYAVPQALRADTDATFRKDH